MRMILVLIAVLSACGAGSLLEASSSSGLRQGTGQVDCPATCERVRDQLVRDFGFTNAQVNCGSFSSAHDCAACQRAFRQAFAVELLSCH